MLLLFFALKITMSVCSFVLGVRWDVTKYLGQAVISQDWYCEWYGGDATNTSDFLLVGYSLIP